MTAVLYPDVRQGLGATYDPANYDVFFLLFQSRESVDANALVALIQRTLEPWYAFPFPASTQMDAPTWVETPPAPGEEYVATYVARSGPLASDQGGRGKYVFSGNERFVTGVRMVMQQRTPATAMTTRARAAAAVLDVNTGSRTGALAPVLRAAGGSVAGFGIVSYAQRMAHDIASLPFPSTPALPGDLATYKSGAVFAVLAGIALGGVLLSAALKRD
jgi:hypothetical protein